ncbi:DUF4429 domain-containing protein [Nocardiopsis sp. MG754419]|uniref:DUF4429 domain-containing protein n=1 Tax=Nocardiopsis sp. MG754419 TaxID=2259865 RepID=UPI001BAB4C1A|nr:DUF4429 domain-containing protein [Nocardiopsis sp. MG754419]MBR8741144.1 hypothetical protein [Nocardiopsis sp. MG754419]
MEELRGHHAIWRFDDALVRIGFGAGRKVPQLFKTLGHCEVPIVAVDEVDFDPGDRKQGWRLRLRLMDGADPYSRLDTTGTAATPLLLTGPQDKELVAEYFAEQLAASVRFARETDQEPPHPVVVARGLVARPPLQVRTAEGAASFDGERLRLQWDGWMTSTPKGREQSRDYRMSEIQGLEWTPQMDFEEGFIRVLLRGVDIPGAAGLEHDFFTLVSHGAKGSDETLLMAATVNTHIAWVEKTAALEPASPGDDSGAIFAKIRELGRLHAEGLLTEDEFSTKKAELLDRL